ncbi:GMP/IMP nucleotidase [Thalassotalea ponticola]|uniref:GMP/IMP nucleotidase n=1 Tax=Thalassotalea ponticola TaxID=1523392 RepID=UPI0025B4B008|nr:GMP/IMP nucleotidase [Thalassotalea ponticola]MDN3652810.1 GMP/IMP nucleotidase [Thalassotalea ponticola]
MLDWANIKTVLLDMDGTILDLHFDNYFWLQHLPKRYAQVHGISVSEAQDFLAQKYRDVEGTISWYCLDYWAEQTNMAITEIKREIDHLIRLRDDAHDFMQALRQSGRQVILVTNAHPDSLSLKIEKTALDKYFDRLISCHQYGVSKESQQLWRQLQHDIGFDKQHTLFVDDTISVLDAAKRYGIAHLLAIANPDSQQPVRHIEHYPAIANYDVLIKDILTQAPAP